MNFTDLLTLKELNNLITNNFWVARDENGWLHLWFREPHRAGNFWIAEQIQDGWLEREEFVQNKHRIDDNLFPYITWADEPLAVKLCSDNELDDIDEKAYERGYDAGFEDGAHNGY